MSDHSDDARRTLERKALKNVRGLLDKLEAEERERIPGALRLLGLVLLIVSVVAVCVAIGVNYLPGGSPMAERNVIVQPPRLRNDEAGSGTTAGRSEPSPAEQRRPRK